MAPGIQLGEIDLPEGILVIIDPGLGRFWRHDGDPKSPRKSDPDEFDLAIEGDDAEAAGKAYDREFDPVHLFDRSDAKEAKKHFDEFATEKGYSAQAAILKNRIPHTERASHALKAGDGLGCVKYNGLWGVVVGGLPSNASLPVVGVPIVDGDFAGRWEYIDIVIDPNAEIARTNEVSGVMVDHGQLLFAGLEPLGQFRMWESLDGLADYVFWGTDAEQLAKDVGADVLGDGMYGWKDVPVGEIGDNAQSVQGRIDEAKLRVGVDYRPHCNLAKLNAAMRASTEDTAQLTLSGSTVVGCGNRWGDGIFSVSRLYDGRGAVCRVRVNLGTPERQELMRKLKFRQLGAIVTRKILDDGEPIRFAERMAPNNPDDSGWAFSSGTEDDEYMDNASNLAIVRLATLVERHPEVAEILDAPVGGLFKREGDRLVVDD